MNLLLRNCHVISPLQNINGRFDIQIANGVIIKMGVIWQHVRELVQYDLAGKIVVPGFFDMHVHFREPGQTHKEDIQSGSNAAAYGGFTGVLCMPNTNPPIDNVETINDNKIKSKDNIVDVHTSACASKNRDGKVLSDISSLIEAGALAITDDGNPVANDDLMKHALLESGKMNKPVIQHCEVMSISDGGVMNDGVVSRKLGLKGISNESEWKIIERDIEFVRQIKNCHYHVQHISTKEAVELVRKAKTEGLNVTAEACPHHFTLTDEAVEKFGTNAKMNPPLRTQEDVHAVIEGLRDGTIDVLCTDHAPHTSEDKDLGMEKALFGIVGLETAVGLSYTALVEKNVLSLEDWIRKMSVNPRKILGLPEIKINEGEEANLTILDLNKDWTVDVSQFHSKSKNSPYDGWKLQCKPVGIVNNAKHLINI